MKVSTNLLCMHTYLHAYITIVSNVLINNPDKDHAKLSRVKSNRSSKLPCKPAKCSSYDDDMTPLTNIVGEEKAT